MLLTSIAAAALSSMVGACPCPGGGISCDQQAGPAAVSGENAELGYDINAATGNLFLAADDISLFTSANFDLEFARYYNSQSTVDVGLGTGWTHSFSWTLTMPDASTVRIREGDGRVIVFTLSGGVWVAQTGEFGTLSGSSAAGFTYTSKIGTQYGFAATTSNFVLQGIMPADAWAGASLTYTSTSPVKINQVSLNGKTLTFSYDVNNHISSITSGSPTKTWTYSVSSGKLASVTFPDNANDQVVYGYADVSVGGGTYTYTSDGGRLVSISRKLDAMTTNRRSLFSYNTGLIRRASSDYFATTFMRDVQTSYACGATVVTTATLSGGSKTITSTPTSGFYRITSLSATAGSDAHLEQSSASMTWSASLLLQTVTDGNGHVTKFNTYDAKGNSTQIYQAYGTADQREVDFTYHPTLGTPLTVSFASVSGVGNHVITYDYDSDYNATYNASPTNFVHQIVDSGKTDAGMAGTLASSATLVTTLNYDGSNRITSIVDPDGVKTTRAYKAGTLKELDTISLAPTLGSSLTWTINTYDDFGRPTKLTEPSGLVREKTYDATGRVASYTTKSGATVIASHQYTYDAIGERTSYTTPDGSVLKYEYDSLGRMTRRYALATAGSGTPLWSEISVYDSWNKVTTFRRKAGTLSDYSDGCAAAGTEEFCKEMGWDSFRRLSFERTLDSTDAACVGSSCKLAFTYDNAGNLASRVEAGTNTTSYARNALDRIIRITLPTAKYSTMTYDVNGRMITRRDPRDFNNGGGGGSRLVTYLNDDFGRLIKMVSSDAGTSLVNYTAAGRKYKAAEDSDGTIQYEYDGAGRLTAARSPSANEDVEYAYDETGSIGGGYSFGNGAGRMTSLRAWDHLGNRVYTHLNYDVAGHVTDDVEERGATGSSTFAEMQYAWGANDELSSASFPDGKTVTYTYPATPVFAPFANPTSYSTTFSGASTTLASGITYFADGAIHELTYGNNEKRTVTRNKRGEVRRILVAPTSGGSALMDERMDFDTAGEGLLTAIHHYQGASNAWDTTFSHDALHRLTGYSTNVRPTTENYTWSYDEVGNRVGQTYTAGTTVTTAYDYPANSSRLTDTKIGGVTQETWTYQSDGRISLHAKGVNTRKYIYNSRGKLTAIQDNASGTNLVRWDYDAYGRVWQRVDNSGNWEQYYYDVNGKRAQTFSGTTGSGASTLLDVVRVNRLETNRIKILGSTTCSPTCVTTFADSDVNYVHINGQGHLYASESKVGGNLVGMGEYDAYGFQVTWARPGNDGMIGTSDDLPSGVGEYEAMFETRSEFENILMDPSGNFSRPFDGNAQGGPSIGDLFSRLGLSAYTPANGSSSYLTGFLPDMGGNPDDGGHSWVNKLLKTSQYADGNDDESSDDGAMCTSEDPPADTTSDDGSGTANGGEVQEAGLGGGVSVAGTSFRFDSDTGDVCVTPGASYGVLPFVSVFANDNSPGTTVCASDVIHGIADGIVAFAEVAANGVESITSAGGNPMSGYGGPRTPAPDGDGGSYGGGGGGSLRPPIVPNGGWTDPGPEGGAVSGGVGVGGSALAGWKGGANGNGRDGGCPIAGDESMTGSASYSGTYNGSLGFTDPRPGTDG